MNTLVLRLKALQDFILESQAIKQELLDELVDNATDPVIRMRRMRMLHDVARYEAAVLQKIASFGGHDLEDWQSIQHCMDGLHQVTNRSA